MSNPRGGDPETVIRQALRAQAGGPARGPARRGSPAKGRPPSRLTTAQVLLIAAIIGLLIGMAAGFTVLLLGR